MQERIGRNDAPIMVQLALWPNLSRGVTWVFFWVSIFLAGASVIYWFKTGRFLAGGLLVFAALWYWMAIQWMDRNRAW